MTVTARATLQPVYPIATKKQPLRVNPAAQKIFRTTFVDSFPEDRSQSTENPPTGFITVDTANGMAESAPSERTKEGEAIL